MIAATHDGVFHADDVFAGALLRMLYEDVIITRTRDVDLIDAVDLRFDVGGRYDPATLDFDHHQPGGAMSRTNGIQFSSFGLLWLVYGIEMTGNEDIADEVDRAFVQQIDAHDNGQSLIGSEVIAGVRPVTVSHIIASFNPSWEEAQDFDTFYETAIDMAMCILQRQIIRARGVVLARDLIAKAIADAPDPRIIVLDRFVPWQEAVIETSSAAQYIVYPAPGGWRCHAVPKTVGGPLRHALPVAWAALDGAALRAVTGVADATFAHRGQFIAGAATKDGAIALARLALDG